MKILIVIKICFQSLILYLRRAKSLLAYGCLISFWAFSLPVFAQEDPTNQPQRQEDFEDFDNKYGQPQDQPEEVLEGNDPEVNSNSNNDQEYVSFTATEVEITDLIEQVHKWTGINFLIDDKTIRGKKITIISDKKITKQDAYQAFLSALEVNGLTTIESPGGFVKIVSIDGKSSVDKLPLAIHRDKTPNTDQFITRIIRMENISASKLFDIVKGLVTTRGNAFALPDTNSLIITDTGSNINRILSIVEDLDREGPQEVLEIIPIYNAEAGDIADKISQIFDDQSNNQRNARSRRTSRRRSSAATPEEIPSISKIIADERTNSVMILGTQRMINRIKAVIVQLDAPIAGVEGNIHVYHLQYANAEEMQTVLSSLVQGSQSSSTARRTSSTASRTNTRNRTTQASRRNTATPSGTVELEGGVKITADKATNSLVITATPKDYQTLVTKVIQKLDVPRPQVYLEAVVMELSVREQRNTGLSGNFGSNLTIAGESISGFGSILPLFPQSIAGIAGAAGGIAGGGFSERTIDFTLDNGQSVSIPAVSAIIQALQTNTDVNVLSTPSILTLDNQEAQIQVGNEVPVPSGTTVATGGVTTFNVSREDTGIILKITPQITESNNVRLNLEQEITDVIGTDPNLGPSLTKRSVQTVVIANDKQTVVIGGLIDDKATVTTGKVPLLGDVPLVGNLFKTKNQDKRKTNIMVFITPYIIRDRSDYMAILKRKLEERNLFIDMNYATSQRKAIRESIKNHSRNLLDYQTHVQSNSKNSPLSSNNQPQNQQSLKVNSTSPKSSQKSNRRQPSTQRQNKYR